MKQTNKLLAILLVVVLVVFACFTLVACDFSPKTDVQTFNIQGDLKVGVISDSQLTPKKKNDNEKFKQNLINALSGLKANEVNMIIFAGDIGDKASNYVYDTYMQCYRTVYGDDFIFAGQADTTYSKDKPLVQTIMGNHDYWGALDGMLSKSSYRKRFEKKLGHSPYTHYVVNGYHFIGASPEQGSPMDNQYNKTHKWIEEQLDIAAADNPNNPIFVTTHNSAQNTVYGSDDWGDKKLYNVFAKYPQVVNISGHLHYSIMDERSMWQGDFTAFSTQSVSYTELEQGKANGTIPPNADITPMGEIMEFESDRILIKRMNFGKKNSATNTYGVEEKVNMRWELPLSLTKDKFTYTTEERKRMNSAPTMPEASGSFATTDDKTTLTFTAGKDDDFVHSYKLVFTSGGKSIERLYFTDFINGIADMKQVVTLQVYDVPKGVYDVAVYAVDSFGLVSSNCITIKSVDVVKEIKYKK